MNDKVSVELEVPFHDVDALRLVWHGHFYKYMEIARCALLRTRGLDTGELSYNGYRLVVAESKCRHSFPLRYQDRFRVTAWFVDIEQRICIAYEIFNLTHNRRSARGRTVLVTIDPEDKLRMATPTALIEKLRRPCV